MRPYLLTTFRWLCYALLGVVLLVGAVLVGINLPPVQTRLAQELTTRVSAKLGFPVSVEKVSIRWLNAVTLENVRIRDEHQQDMIRVGRLELDFRLRYLLDSASSNLHLDKILLYRPDVKLIKNGPEGQLNLDRFIEAIDRVTTDPAHPGIPNHHTPFTIGQGRVIDGAVSMHDPREPRAKGPTHFDENHFDLTQLNGNIKNLLILGDTIALTINNMSSRERRADLNIRRLDTRLLFCNTNLELANLRAEINQSLIRDYLLLTYKKPGDFSNFNHVVNITARLHDCNLYSHDLGRFSSYLLGLSDTYRVTTDLRGTVDNLRLLDTDLRFGPQQRSHLAGDMVFRNLPDVSRTIAGLHYRNSSVNMADTRPYYPDPTFATLTQKLGTVNFTGDFIGPFDNFRAAGRFETGLGTVAGHLDLHLGKTGDQTTYNADLRSNNLHLGELVNEPGLIQQADGELQLSGRGTAAKTAIVDVNGTFARLVVRGHPYRNVRLKGNLQRAFFTGDLNLRDPNLTADVTGDFDLSQPQNRFDLRGNIAHADLRALGLGPDSLTIQTRFDVNLEGNTLNTMVGEARFRQADLTLNRRLLHLDSLRISSVITAEKRLLAVQSNVLSGWFSGSFQPDRVLTDLTRLVDEYKLYFTGSTASRERYYANKRLIISRQKTEPDYVIDYSVILRNTGPVLDWLNQRAFVAPQSTVDGQLRIRRVSEFTANVRTDSLALGRYQFGRSDLDLFTSKATLGDSVLVSAILNSDRQQFGALTPTEQLVVDANWGNGELSFNSRIKQTGSTNRAVLNGDIRFLPDAIQLTFRKSQVRLLDNDWLLNPTGSITKIGDSFRLADVSATNGAQLLMADGEVSADSSQSLKINARQFRLATLNPLLNVKLGGLLNGTARVRNLIPTATGIAPIVESQLEIDSLAYADVLLGDVRGNGTWDPARQRVNIDAHLSRDSANVLTVGGSYAPGDARQPFDLTGTVTGAGLNLIEPFTKGIFSNIGGTVDGQLHLVGNATKPVLTGELGVRGGRLRFDYLNTEIYFDDKIQFRDGSISARSVTVRDAEGNTGTIRGGAYHSNFRQFGLNISADLTRFRVLNTTLKDNELYYGTAYATGHVDVTGPLDNLTIRADATSNKNTRLFMPLDGARTVSTDNLIQFVNRRQLARNDSTRRATPTVDLSGINMEFNFNVTPDAYCEIQLNRQTGDIIKAYGAGQVAMRVNTSGDFNITGTYDINQGDYTFTFENVINKRFQIKPGSSIVWTGDPYAALLNVTAAYTQYTSLAPLLASVSTTNTTDQTRRYPVDLLIKLNGQLLAPDISFDLKVKEYPSQSDYRQAVSAFEARLLSSEQELARQVSSMLIFNSLIAENAGLLDGGTINTGAINSLSELLSNQISRLASTLSDKLDLGVSLGGFTNNAVPGQNDNLLNNLQLRFSYRLLNDRLRISRDGGFTYGQSQTSTASVVGEWTLEYRISADGRLRAKMYNRNQQSALGQYAGYGTSTLTPGGGLSLLYTRSFNSFGGSKRSKPGLVQPVVAPTVPPDSLPKLAPRPPVVSSTE